MCGITGCLPRNGLPEAELRQRVLRMTAALVHRGPDDSGSFISDHVGLGVRRLSIIDRAHGHQPMRSDDGALVLVFNGEIYNHRALRRALEADGARFRTESDTEVVLRLLEREGLDGTKKLEGMFCFALWNTRTRELTLARDWLGQKSLFWIDTPNGFYFASEIKALLTIPGVVSELDVEALSHYLSLRYLPGESTFFRGIRKLPAAHVMTLGFGTRQMRELWRPAYEPKHDLSETQIVDRLDGLMADVVAEHLMSEVPLGAFLSGGIDSSLIVGYASRVLQEPLTTFAIGVHDEAQSELPWARQVAGIYHTLHRETIVDPDLAALTPRMVASLEEPVDPFGAGVYIVSEVARREVTVVLGGDGGDELFAGYDRYKGQRYAELYATAPAWIRHKLLRPVLARLPDSYGYNSLVARLRWLDRIADSDGFERYADSAAWLRFPHEMKRRLFTEPHQAMIERSVSEQLLRQYFEDGAASDPLDRFLHADCRTRLSDNQLPIVDRMSMAHSLELRSPFLDRRVAEFAMRIPAGLKLRHGRLKYVTRELARRYLPAAIADRPKKGFGFPLAKWLRGPLAGLMQAVIDESRFVEHGLFRHEALQQLQDEHVGGRVDHNYRLWMIFNLEIFWRHYIDGEPVGALEEWIRERRLRSPGSAGATAQTARRQRAG